MNEFQRQLRVLRNQFKRWMQENGSTRNTGGQRPNIKMCPSCGRFNDARATECVFCQSLLDPKPTATVGLDGTVQQQANPNFVVFAICIFAHALVALLSANLTGKSFMGGLFSPNGQALFYLGANSPSAVMAGEWWRVATYAYLHGGIGHIFFNLSALGSLGNMVWEYFGTRRFWVITLVTAITGGLLSALLPIGSSGLRVGFSGALFGYLGALFIYFRQQGQFSVADRLKKYLIWGNVIFIALTVLRIFPIDNRGHIGGMLGGMAVAWGFRNKAIRNLGDNFERFVIVACAAVFIYGFYSISGYIQDLPR